MMYIADLHIHSRFSRATSRDCDLPHLDWWARRKGIGLLGTGDFTHPAWRAELKEQLVSAGEGVYMLKEEYRLPAGISGEAPRFVVTGEISSIYKRDGKTRKVHNLILLPSLEAADALSAKLEAVGNIHSDGRPILGMDSRDLMELTLTTCPDAEFIPAHIWTPHFSMFGAFSGFHTIESCFDDMTPHIHAVETGLSSDPPMNWRVSALDGLTLVSHSDAHSPAKLGREANLLNTDRTYPALVHAIRTGDGFLGTIEFFPEEGKYHLDGHRNCGVCLTPQETAGQNGICPVCGRKLTIGVEHRVEELADRPAGFCPENAKPFESLAPLPEVIAASTGGPSSGKRMDAQYERLLHELGSEFDILRRAPIEEIAHAAGPCVAEGIRRLRTGQVERRPGFDGEYGTISLLTPAEIEQFGGQMSFFSAPAKKAAKPQAKHKRPLTVLQADPAAPSTEMLNPQQRAAIPVINQNPGDPRTLSPNRPSGTAVRLIYTADDFAEGVFIAKEIGRMTGGVDMLEAQNADHGRDIRAFSDIAVLCRTHRQLELVESCLRHDDIPCVVVGREDFLDADEVRGVLAFFRSLQEVQDTAALETAMRLLWNCPADLIRRASDACQKLSRFDPELLRETVRGFGHLELWLAYAEKWLPLLDEKPYKLIARWAEEYGKTPAVDRLYHTAVFHKSFAELWNTLVLGEEADVSRAAGKRWESGAVKLMTLHGAKGLEFPAVFVAGVKAGTLPLEIQGRPADVEEERRLLYVGMTRAREELLLTAGEELSPFLRGLPSCIKEERLKRRERPAEQTSLF